MKKYVFLSLLILSLLQISCKYDLPLPERPREIVNPKEPIDSLPAEPIDSLPGEPIDTLPEIPPEEKPVSGKIRVILDTDANNELDDQHAIAYLLFNGNTFTVEGITVNATWNGGSIQGHFDEADRVIRMCAMEGKFPLLKGANGSFTGIENSLQTPGFDGEEAVNFIIKTSKEATSEKLVILAVGKLTNVALALKKDPSIKDRIKIVWLGSNYPEKGEYNMDNDIPSMNYVLNTDVEFEMVTVRNYKSTGTDAVRVSKEEIDSKMPGKGPYVNEAVPGRHGNAFHNFGDYSVDLFDHITLYGNPPSRAMFDMAAVAIVKEPEWATATEIPAPINENKTWIDRPNNNRKIIIWEYFDRDAIMGDFFNTMDNYIPVNQ